MAASTPRTSTSTGHGASRTSLADVLPSMSRVCGDVGALQLVGQHVLRAAVHDGLELGGRASAAEQVVGIGVHGDQLATEQRRQARRECERVAPAFAAVDAHDDLVEHGVLLWGRRVANDDRNLGSCRAR